MIPRRIADYPDSYEGWNYVSSIGSMISVAATAVFIYVIYDMLITQPKTLSNPWRNPTFYKDNTSYVNESRNDSTLEWSVESPTPYHAYQMIPVQS